MRERFVSEEIRPLSGSFDAAPMATGEPGLPARFSWRGTEYQIVDLLESWKQLSPPTSSGDDRYLRRHWFRIRCGDGIEMKLYFDRQGKPGGRMSPRWFLYTVIEPGDQS